MIPGVAGNEGTNSSPKAFVDWFLTVFRDHEFTEVLHRPIDFGGGSFTVSVRHYVDAFLGNAIADVVFDCDVTVFHPMQLIHNAPVPGVLNFFVATINLFFNPRFGSGL